jgi:putative membrane protein
MKRAMLAAGLAALISTSAFAASSKDLVANAMRSDKFEIALSQLAPQRAASEDVKQFAVTLFSDRMQAKLEMEEVGAALGVALPIAETSDETAETQKLSTLTNEAFDREFIRVVIDDHTRDIAAFRSATTTGNNQLAQIVKQQLTVLETDLETAEKLAQSERVARR